MIVDAHGLLLSGALRLDERDEERVPIAAVLKRAAALTDAVDQQRLLKIDLHPGSRLKNPVRDAVPAADTAVCRLHADVQVVKRHVPPRAARPDRAAQSVGVSENLCWLLCAPGVGNCRRASNETDLRHAEVARAEAIVKARLDCLILQFEETNPPFVMTYQNARKVTDTGSTPKPTPPAPPNP